MIWLRLWKALRHLSGKTPEMLPNSQGGVNIADTAMTVARNTRFKVSPLDFKIRTI